jgi:hypothetical protein
LAIFTLAQGEGGSLILGLDEVTVAVILQIVSCRSLFQSWYFPASESAAAAAANGKERKVTGSRGKETNIRR